MSNLKVMVVCGCGCDSSKWFCNHKSLICRRFPEELHDVEFPWFRQMFLLVAVAFYIADTGLDIFVAYEHHKHYLEGDDDSKWYFILTIVFIVLPSVVMNFVSWGLYVWCYLVNNWKQCNDFLREKCLRVKRGFGSALMYVNYTGRYSPAKLEHRQRQQAEPQLVLEPHPSLRSDLERIAHQSIFERQDVDNEVDGNIQFKAIDELNFISLLFITILHVFQFGLLVRVLQLIYLSSNSRCSYYRYYDLTFLKLIESFMEAAPQLVLQLYIYIVSPESDPVYRVVTPVSMLFSLVSLALAITDYHSAGKDTFHYMFKTVYKNWFPRLSWIAYFVIFFWQLCLIISRTLAFTFFATEFGLYLFVFLLAHFLVMVIWIYSSKYEMFECKSFSNNDETCLRKGRVYNYCCCLLQPFVFLSRNCCLEIVIAAFNSFFFFKFTETSRRATLLYYLLQGIENSVLICLFFAFTDFPLRWNYITGFISTFVSFALGVAFMVLYYYYYHPVRQLSRSTHNEDPIDFNFESRLASEFYGKIHLTFTVQWLILLE